MGTDIVELGLRFRFRFCRLDILFDEFLVSIGGLGLFGAIALDAVDGEPGQLFEM